MSFKTILDQVQRLGETLAPFLEGTPAAPILAIGTKVIELIDTAKEVVSEDDAAALSALRDRLEPLVLAHAKDTAAALRGEETG